MNETHATDTRTPYDAQIEHLESVKRNPGSAFSEDFLRLVRGQRHGYLQAMSDVAPLLAAAEATLSGLENMTTAAFSEGADKTLRDALSTAIAKAHTGRREGKNGNDEEHQAAQVQGREVRQG